MDFSSNFLAYTKSVLLPFYLLTFVVIFALFGISNMEPYYLTVAFLLILSILLILKNKSSSKFSFDIKKNLILKGKKSIFPRDIESVVINKKGSLLRINLIFDHKGSMRLSNNIRMDELTSFLNLVKKSNKNYKVKNTTSPTAYPLLFGLLIVYIALFLVLNTSKKMELPSINKVESSTYQRYDNYSFKVPSGFYSTNSEGSSFTFVDKNNRIIVVDNLSLNLNENQLKYLSYMGINGYYDFFNSFKSNNYSLLYAYLKNKSKSEEYYLVDYTDTSHIVFYKENSDSFFISVNKDNRKEALIFYFRNFSKEDFLAISDNIGSSLSEQI